MKKPSLLTPHSVAPIKLPTLFAEFTADLSVVQKPFVDCSGCENNEASSKVTEILTKAVVANPELVWDHWNPQDANLRAKIAALHGVAVNQVFLTSGAIAGVEYCFRMFTKTGTRTGIMKPGWPGFDHYADFNGNEKVYLENFDFPFVITAAMISEFVKKNQIECMILANPVPVQGHLIPKNELDRLIAENPTALFIIDEADTISPEKQAPGLVKKYQNVIFIGSFSKFYGLSGLRLGYVIVPEAYIAAFKNTINVIEVSSLAILAGNAVLADQAYQQKTQQNVRDSIAILNEACHGSPYEFSATADCFGGFIYSKTLDPKVDFERAGIKILEGQYFGLPESVCGGRVNLSSPENARQLAIIIKNSVT